MAMTFPLDRTAFFDLLPIQAMTFDCPEQLQQSRTGDGAILTADLGTRLWQGEVQLGPMTRTEAARVRSLLDVLRGAGRSFFVYDAATPAPLQDPDLAFLGTAAPTLHTVGGDGRSLRVTGLPAGYVLSAGDLLSFSYLSAPMRYALHRVVTETVADGTGLTPLFEVTPNVRPGASAGAAVTLDRPWCKALLVPGSVNTGMTRHTLTEGARFSFIQTLR